MTVTDIKRQRNNSERFSVFIDCEFAFGLSGADVQYYKLNIGDELSPERYEYLVNEVLVTKAMEKAFFCLTSRPRTRKELLDKLNEYPAETVDKVLEVLTEQGYINDRRFADDYIDSRIRSKAYGKRRLRHELAEKGVDRRIIDEALEETQFDESEAALGKLIRRAKYEPLDERDRRRHFDYLVRQGYAYDVIKQAFKEYEAML